MRIAKLLAQNSTSTKSIFNQIWEEVKRPTSVPFFLIIFWKAVSTIQILALMLEIGCGFFENTAGTWSFLGVPRFFIFRKKFDFDDRDSVTDAFFLLCCIAVLANYLFYVATFIGAKLRLPVPCVAALCTRYFMLVHQYVLFLPIQMYMLEVIETARNKNIVLYGSNSDSLFMIIAIIVVILNFIGGLLNLRCYSSLYAPKSYCKRNAYLAFADLLYKTGASTLIVMTSTTESAKWILISFTLIYLLIMHSVFHYQLPYFQIKLLEVYCVLLGSKIAFGVVMFFAAVFDEFWEVPLPDLPIAALVLTLPIGISAQFNLMWKTLMKTATFDEKNMKTENDVFNHLLGLRYLIKKGSATSLKNGKQLANDWSLQLHGVIVRHNVECNNTNCGCRTFLETEDIQKGLGPRRDKYRELKILLMRNLYEKGADVVPFSELLLLNLAQFYLLYLENYLKSYLVLQAFEKRPQKSFETDVLIGYIKTKIQERMELKLSGNGQQGSLISADYESNNLNVTALVQNDMLFLQLKNCVTLQVKRQLKFWDLFENFELNTRQVESCCEDIDLIRSRIEKLWDNLSQINQKCSSHYLLYGLYQTLINNTTKRGERFLSDYSRMYGVNSQENEAITNENLYDPSTVIIRISMRRDKIGTIEESSGDLEGIFGYQPSEIIDSNVWVVMSQFFKERHHNFVMNHFEKGTENALNRIKRLYGCHKEGHIFPIFLYVSIYPNIEKGLSYMGIIRPRKVYNNYILVKHDGTVDSYSPEIAEYLSLDTRKKYNITEICPDFEKINNAFNYVTKRKYTNLYDEELPDYKADSLARRSNDYQLKVTNAIESQKKLAEGADEIPKTVSGSQPLLNSMNTDHYEPSASATASGDQEHKRLASLDTKDYASVSKPTKGSKEGAKTMGKGGARSQVHKKFRRLNTEDIEEYQKIYDQMSVNGSVLNFTTNGNKAETATRSYLCTVADEIFDYSILRIITLGRNDETINGEKDADMQLKNPNRAITEAKAFSPIMKPKSNPGSGKKPKNNNISVQEREISILDMTADKGISDMPHQDGFQVFKNPFSPEESEHQEEPADKLKETIHNLLATNPEPAESQLMFSSRKDLPSELRDNHSSKAGYIHNKSNSSGNNLEQFDDKYHDSKDFIQELMLNADGKMNKVEVSSMSSGSLRGGGSVVSKLESLLYKKTRGRSSNKFKIYYGIIAVCIILAIVDVAVSSNFLETGSERVQMMLYVGGRINYLLNLYYQTVNLNLSLKGLMDTNRHLDTLGIADFPQYMFNAMRPAAEVLLDANARVMNDIGNLQESSKARFYKNTVAIQYPSAASSTENVASLNSFLAVDTLARSALEIASVAFPDLSTMQENIDYILLNSVNDLYLEMRNSYKIYEEDLDDNSSKGRLIAWGMAIAAISIYILFCALLVRDMTSTYKDKIRFWNSLVKLETEKSISHKKMLHVIKDNLEGSSNYSLLKRALIDTKKQEAKTVKTSKDKSTQGGGFKRLKTYKFQNRNYFIILPFMIIFVLILVFFILSAVFVGVEASNKKVYMDEIRNAETYYQLNVITANGVYQYIDQGSSSKIESVPVLDSVNTNLARLAKLGHFVNSFENKNGFSPRAYLQQDYCLTFTTPAEISQCRTIGNGLNVHGLVGILTYSKDALMRVMDVIRSSAQTVSDKKDALKQDSLITMEAEYMYLTGGFENLFKLLLQGEKDSQDSFQSNQIVFIVVFVVLLVVLNYIMVLAGFKRLDGQKFDNMKILRVIPVSMILESKMLKTYLLKSFKDDLSSVKNKM